MAADLEELDDWSEIDFGVRSVPLPSRIANFEISGRLGVGGMGVVLDARTAAGQRVALKLIRPTVDRDRRSMLTSRLLREARILEGLDHAGIVRLVESGEHKKLVYVAMEQVIGVTLADVRRHGPLELGPLISIGRQLSSTLTKLHAAGVVHRDIKPGNVLIDGTGRVVLADFGIAKDRETTGITRAGEVIGSVGYLAPECFRGLPPSPASDQYALGRLLFELATTSAAPAAAPDAPIIVQFALRMEIHWDRFPKNPPWPAMEKLLHRMTQERPSARFPSAAACHQAFVELDRLDADNRVISMPDSGTSPKADDTVFAQVDTLVNFVARLEIEPRPWEMWDLGDVGGEGSDDLPLMVELSTADHAMIDVPSMRRTESGADRKPSSVPDPALAPPASSPLRSISRSNIVGRPHRIGALRPVLSLLLGVTLGLCTGLATRTEALRRLEERLSLEPSARFVHQNSRVPTAGERSVAEEMHRAAKRELASGNADAAQSLLGGCIELADLAGCHETLALLLSLMGDSAALAHSAKAFAAGE